MIDGAREVGAAAARRCVSWAAAVILAASLAACGGGGGGSTSSGTPPPSGNPPPAGNPPATGGTGVGTVKVTVTDQLGDPVPRAHVGVTVLSTAGSINKDTDANGLAQFDEVAAGKISVCASHPVRGYDRYGCSEFTVQKGRVLEVSRPISASQNPTVAVLQATADPGGVSADGRSLDLTVRVAVTRGREGSSWFLTGWGLGAERCEARTGAELAELGPRCIANMGGGDVSYGGELKDAGVVRAVSGLPRSGAVGLLIDQSETGLSPDWAPNEPRLFNAKILADSLLPDVPVAIAGFGSDTASGSASSLPQRPVTFFPVDAPGFVGSRSDAFETLNDLGGLVGGGAPLYEAIAAGIDFMADRSPSGSLPTLVVLADGTDSSCGTAAQCAQWRRTLARRAQETGVRLFLAGYESTDNMNDGAEECSASDDEWEWYICSLTFGAKAPLQELSSVGGMPLTLGWNLELVRQWVSGSMTVQDIRLRLTSEVEGAFSPGAVVTGRLRGSNESWCSWDCYVVALPFRVEVPQGAP